MTFHAAQLGRSSVGAYLEKERLERSIRALELELGLRGWDARDRREAEQRLGAMVRITDADQLLAFVKAERRRLTSARVIEATT